MKNLLQNVLLKSALFIFMFLLSTVTTVLAQVNYAHETLLTASDGQVGDGFGMAVAIDGFHALVGAPYEEGEANDYNRQGSAYFFQYANNAWSETQIVKGSGIAGSDNTYFGAALAMDESTAILSAPGYSNHEGTYVPGMVYVFKNDGQEWLESQIIIPVQDSMSFGQAVDIDGEWLAIGSPSYPGYWDTDTGAVYIYRNEGTSWELNTRIVASDLDSTGGFGSSLSISGNALIVGTEDHGAYIFRYVDSTSTWVEEKIIREVTVNSWTGNISGNVVGIDGDMAIVGTFDYDGLNTIVFLYYDGTEWMQPAYENVMDWYTYGFASSVALSEDFVAIGANLDYGNDQIQQGLVHVYRHTEVWSDFPIMLDSQDGSYLNFGTAVDMNGSVVIGGAPGGESPGRAYIHELTQRPEPVVVSNGLYTNRNKVTWNNDSGETVNGFSIYRENELVGETPGGAVAYYDYDAIPGKLHTYSVAADGSNWGWSMPASGLGWQTLNGNLAGSVKTPYGAGVDSVEIQINSTDVQLNSSLEFNDNTDYMIANPHTNFPEDEITVSFWMKTVDVGTKYSFSYAVSVADNNAMLIGRPDDLEILVGNQSTGGTGVAFNDSSWHHLAVTWRSSDGELNVLKDGILSFTGMMQAGYTFPANGSLVLGQDQDNVGGGFDPNQAFSGLLDEVRIWNKVRTPEEIQEFMYKKLNGDEYNLASYWSFDDLPTRTPENIVGDYAKDSGNHGILGGPEYSEESSPVSGVVMTDEYGSYKIENVYYDASSQIELVPYKWGHGFDPAFRNITMNMGNYELEAVSFIDTTALTISGTITYEGTQCSVPEVEIFLDNSSTNVFTNSAGEFSITIDQPGYYNLKFHYADSASAHGFSPNDFNVNMESNLLGLEILDTTRYELAGMFRGPCEAIIGRADIIVSSMGDAAGCFQDTIETDSNGNFSTVLPAQQYVLTMLNVYPDDPTALLGQTVVQYFGADTLDLRWQDKRHDFIYRTTPEIAIHGWPDFGQTPFAVPILEQGEFYDLEIEVLDVWEGESCPVNQGSITIWDAISGIESIPITIELVNGIASYRCVPGEPSILTGDNPYQKSIFVVANIGEETVDHTQYAVIEGLYPLAETFTTISPEMVLWVLHDPPGDQSYSFLSQDTTLSSFYTQTFHWSTGHGGFLELNLGAVLSLGEWVATEVGGYVIAGINGKGVAGGGSADGKILTFTTKEEFSTSNNDQIVGSGGDVFVGASFNEIFQLTKRIAFDWTENLVIADTSVAWDIDDIATTFLYTESHIEHTLIPQLTMLRDLAVQEDNQAKVDEYTQAIGNWQRQLFINDSIVTVAPFERNISFSAGATATYTQTSSEEISETWTSDTAWDLNWKVGIGVVIAGCTSEIGYEGYYEESRTDDSTHTTTTTTTTGYTFSDDDPGDFFSVNVKKDPRGTPAFELFSGTSSNPWEAGTQPRDGVNIAMNKYALYNIPPEDPAPFILYLGNTSESGEEREYHLSVIQSSNLDGAIIRVGGVVIEDYLSYTIPAGEQLNATLSVERGPISYDYENLKIKFYAPGDEEAIADTAIFSVHYISPCSDVNLLIPENNWLVNSSDNDTLQFVINDFDADNPHLESIKFQYRKIGDSWATPFIYGVNELTTDFVMEYWEINHLPDGEYELRAVSDCGSQGVRYSDIASGIIDRQALVVFGTPEPSDGVWNTGEDISISFSGEIDPAYLSANNARLISLEDSTAIEVTIAQYENTIIITPVGSLDPYEDQILEMKVWGIRDIHGNYLRTAAIWTFRVNLNPIYWTVSNINHTVYQDRADSFIRTLKNAGTASETFAIISHPAWLTPGINTGTIPPDGEQEITFSVNTQLNVGFYQDTVVVQVGDNAEENLIVSLTVLNEPPSWIVDPAAYSYSMNITAVMTFEDTISRDVYDIVSVYTGDEVRGIANIEYLSSVDKYVAFLTVYSNQVSGEALTFRMWDASAGKEYAHLEGSYTFEQNSSLGTIANPVVIRSDASVQAIQMNQGWTWISLNVATGPTSVANAMENITPSNGDIIKGQKMFAQYDSDLGWCGPLSELEIGKSYQVYLQNGGALRYTGNPINYLQANISLHTGWNWIGHLNQRILDLNETFDALTSTAGDRIKSQTEFADYVAATQTWEGSLKKLVPGQGYLLKTGQESSLQYPVLGKANFSYPAILEWDVDINSYEFNMGMTAVVEFDNAEITDSTVIVGAFSDYVCRGVTQLTYIAELERYVGFLPIYANKASGDSVYFQVYSPLEDKIRQVSEKVSFLSDQQLGTLSNPYAIVSQPVGDELVPDLFYLTQNYPNPFNPTTTIEYGIPRDEKVKLYVYNTLGQRVVTLVDEQQAAHRYTITFDANEHGLASGIYFYQIKAGNYVEKRKLVFIK